MTSLAERLGFGPDDRIMIVNCDDIGSSHACNVAAERAMREGWATSATLMVPCPWAREAVDRFKDLDVGVHLTLTAEYPDYRWRSLTGAKSLHDADGYLPTTIQEVFRNARLEDAEAECRAQIDQALAWGIDVTHIDNHMGALSYDARFSQLALKLAIDYDLPMRLGSASAEQKAGIFARAPATDAGRLYPDRFVMQWGRPSRDVLHEMLPALRPGVTEFCMHPVEDGPELQGYDKTQAWIRTHDYACLMDEELRALVKKADAKLISYRPLRDAMRKQ
ncbi:MAG TPA: polysaccharide deacetylase family protein [Rhizomicrobium sp.]|nr:polysaccharide deacetylase family protein [Rhizomicrobium sp.]